MESQKEKVQIYVTKKLNFNHSPLIYSMRIQTRTWYHENIQKNTNENNLVNFE